MKEIELFETLNVAFKTASVLTYFIVHHSLPLTCLSGPQLPHLGNGANGEPLGMMR